MLSTEFKKLSGKILLLITALFVAITAQAQSMRSIWLSIPDSLIPYLNREMRIQMVNAEGDTITSSSGLTNKSLIVTLAADYIKAVLTEASTIEMKRFATMNGDSVLAVVNTFYAPEPESRLDIYDTTWNLLCSNIRLNAGIKRPDSMMEEEFKEIKNKMEPITCVYHLSPKDDTLIVAYSLPMLNEFNKQQVKAILQDRNYKLPILLQNEVK